MANAILEDDLHRYPAFQYKCPLGCPNEKRWICTTCGDFVAIKFDSYKIICSCGSNPFRENLLSCPGFTHHTGNQQISSHVSNTNNPEPKELHLIKVQLEKYLKSCQEEYPFIDAFRRVVDPTTPITEINDILRNIDTTKLTGDTAHLIREYCEKS